jgi:transcription elongation factor Elf1
MSQDNVLKKEFSKKDVTRVRNVMSGKAGERTVDGIGYTKQQIHREEGDIWTENGREWTIKDGLRQNITRLDKVKEALMPMFCPSCNKIMKSHLDDPVYKYFRRCFNCQAKFEMDLRLEGLFDDWKKELDNSAIDLMIDGARDFLEDALTESNQGWVSEAGEVQKWRGGINKELAYKSLNETIEYLESLKK